jgi:hypothetical protein
MNARPRPDDQLEAPFAGGWSAFITADQDAKRHIGRVRELFGDLELVLLDAGDVIVAADWAVPGGLAPLHLDRDTGEGVYIEPGIWVQHR